MYSYTHLHSVHCTTTKSSSHPNVTYQMTLHWIHDACIWWSSIPLISVRLQPIECEATVLGMHTNRKIKKKKKRKKIPETYFLCCHNFTGRNHFRREHIFISRCNQTCIRSENLLSSSDTRVTAFVKKRFWPAIYMLPMHFPNRTSSITIINSAAEATQQWNRLGMLLSTEVESRRTKNEIIK